MCRCEATSREHVPPRNLFPEKKDLGEEHRKDLVTVPSCELHNSAKSHEDEFLMVSLVGIIGNNSLGYRHRLTKVDRAVKRSANRLLDRVFTKKKTTYTFKLHDNKFIDVIWGTPDVKRLHRCFDHIARGIHFHHFGRRFEGTVKLLLGYLFHDESEARTWSDFIRDRSELDLVGKPRIGENPEVFYFQVTDYDEFGLFLIKLCFYGGLNVYAAFLPSASNPPNNFVALLMEKGIPTVLTLGEKSYAFNTKSET